MRDKLKILNKKEIKKILELIKKQWNAVINLDYAFLQNEKGKIYIINRDLEKINLEKLRINSIGLYFAEVRDNEIRLSIEGSQIIGPKATKNVLEINEEEAKKWFKGEDLEVKGNYSGFVILKNKNDFLGCGKYRDGKVFNFVGKARRISS